MFNKHSMAFSPDGGLISGADELRGFLLIGMGPGPLGE
jgi:hypothetical protein